MQPHALIKSIIHAALAGCLLLAVLARAATPSPAIATVGNSATPPDLQPCLRILEDPGGQLARADVLKQLAGTGEIPPVKSANINRGYTRSALWVMCELRTTADVSGLRYLEIAYPGLDRVELHLQTAGADWQTFRSGDHLPMSERPIAHRNIVFPLTLTPETHYRLLLRVSTESVMAIPLTLWTPTALMAQDHFEYSLLALYFGSLGAMMLYNALLGYALRDRAYLYYVLMITSLGIGWGGLSGIGGQLAWPDWPLFGNMAPAAGLALTGVFSMLFSRNFLHTREHTPWLDRLLLLAGIIYLIGALCAPFAYRIAAHINSLLGLVAPILVLLASGSIAYRGKEPAARYFFIAWVSFATGTLTVALQTLGLLPTNGITRHAMQMGSAMEMLLLSFALAHRYSALRKEKEGAQAAMLASQEQLLRTLRENEQELERRVNERTSELQITTAALEKLAHYDALTGAANRAMFNDRLEHALSQAHRQGRSCAVLLIDLDFFKPINDRHGHAAGDTVLKTLAERWHATLRESDTLARLGGDEFAVLIEDVGIPENLSGIAEKLLAAARQPIPLEGETVEAATLGASIGIAIFPEHADSASALLRTADKALYEAKHEGRDNWKLAIT